MGFIQVGTLQAFLVLYRLYITSQSALMHVFLPPSPTVLTDFINALVCYPLCVIVFLTGLCRAIRRSSRRRWPFLRHDDSLSSSFRVWYMRQYDLLSLSVAASCQRNHKISCGGSSMMLKSDGIKGVVSSGAGAR